MRGREGGRKKEKEVGREGELGRVRRREVDEYRYIVVSVF